MRRNDIATIAQLLKGVDTIDILGFGSCVSPDYLLQLIVQAHSQTGIKKKYGVICPTFTGSGYRHGVNILASNQMISWAIGGFFGAARGLGDGIIRGDIDGYTLPQGIVNHLLGSTSRAVHSNIGLKTLVDPSYRGGALGDNPQLKPVTTGSADNTLNYSLPHSELVLLRGSGFLVNGDVILEKDPIDLDLKRILDASLVRRAKVIIQVPEITLPPSPLHIAIPRCFFSGVFSYRADNHCVTYRNDYSLLGDNKPLYREGNTVRKLSTLLEERVSKNEKLIVGIGLPVAAINQLNLIDSGYSVSIESGNQGGFPIDGLGFGISIDPVSINSQTKTFQDIWSRKFDHALLGVGNIDEDGNVYVAKLGGSLFGVGGFIDIVDNVNKITFIGRYTKKKLIRRDSNWICFRNSVVKDVDYILT